MVTYKSVSREEVRRFSFCVYVSTSFALIAYCDSHNLPKLNSNIRKIEMSDGFGGRSSVSKRRRWMRVQWLNLSGQATMHAPLPLPRPPLRLTSRFSSRKNVLCELGQPTGMPMPGMFGGPPPSTALGKGMNLLMKRMTEPPPTSVKPPPKGCVCLQVENQLICVSALELRGSQRLR